MDSICGKFALIICGILYDMFDEVDFIYTIGIS